MRFKKRRRRPVEWVTTNYSTAPDFDGTHYGITPILTVVYGGPTSASPYVPINGYTPILVGDEPDVANTLTEERKTYTIRRIVGDMHFAWGRSNTVGTGAAGIHPAMVKWGFAVQNVPPDVASLVPSGERLWQPFSDTVKDFTESPWLSMKTEIYGANQCAYPTQSSTGNGGLVDNSWDTAHVIQDYTGYYYPASRHHHIDIKVARTVGRNQRLLLTCSVSGLSTDDALYNWKNNQHQLLVYADLRVLINWRAAYNRRG